MKNNITQLNEISEKEAVATASAPESIDDYMGAEGEEGQPEDAEQALKAMREARRAAMDSVGLMLSQRLQEAVTFRSHFEAEWSMDIVQFETGNPDENQSAQTKQYASDNEDYRSSSDNITRPAVLNFAARLGDMIFPTNDRNWDVDTTPEPDLPPEVAAEAEARAAENNLKPEQIDGLMLEMAKKRMNKMRTQMDDQLSEARYNAEGREVIMDACKMGFGVLRGPFAKTRKKRRYSSKQGFKAEIVEDMTSPNIERVDPWNVFPMPCRRVEDCSGVFEVHEMSAKKLADLRNQPGFSSEQVGRALKSPPTWAGFNVSMVGQRRVGDTMVTRMDELYPVVSYDGDMPQDALLIFLEQLLAESSISEEQRDEILHEAQESNSVHVSCNVWMCCGTVLKIAISPIDHCNQMYKFFTIEDRDDSPFGRSISSILRDSQRNVRMLWQAILLNSMMSAGVQIAVRKGALVPIGPNSGAIDLRFTSPRVWAFGDEIEDVNKAMQAFQIPNTVGALLPVYERAKQNGQEQCMVPAIVGTGEPTQAIQTSSGLAMLMNAANIVQRRVAMKWDDSITTPVITDWYEWNMRYGPDEAKGDYKVVARASSHLLVKDVQAQHFMTALQLFQSNPFLQPRMKEQAWAEEMLRIMDIDAARFILSEDEFEAKQAEAAKAQQQPDPDTLRAQAAVKLADARTLEAQTDAKASEEKLRLQAEDRALDYEDRIADRESRENIAAMQVQAAMAGLDADAQARVMEMQAEMQKEADRNATETRNAGMRAAEKAQELQFKKDKMQTEIAVESTNPGPRLA